MSRVGQCLINAMNVQKNQGFVKRLTKLAEEQQYFGCDKNSFTHVKCYLFEHQQLRPSTLDAIPSTLNGMSRYPTEPAYAFLTLKNKKTKSPCLILS